MDERPSMDMDTNILRCLNNNVNGKTEKSSSDSEESLVSDVSKEINFTNGNTPNQKLWNSFQVAAISIAHLYKSCDNLQKRCGNGQENMKEPFQTASLAITALYKEALEAQQRKFELGFQVGQKKRTKELYTWLNSAAQLATHHSKPYQKKSNNHFNFNNSNRIKKDELLSFLEYLDIKSTGIAYSRHSKAFSSPKPYFSSPRGNYVYSSSPSPSPNSVHGSRVSFSDLSPLRANNNNCTNTDEINTNDFTHALNMNADHIKNVNNEQPPNSELDGSQNIGDMADKTLIENSSLKRLHPSTPNLKPFHINKRHKKL